MDVSGQTILPIFKDEAVLVKRFNMQVYVLTEYSGKKQKQKTKTKKQKKKSVYHIRQHDK